MKTVLGIFARDMKALLRNPVALIVVVALLILPGLYAWYCIVANWNPYSNTGNMPIAIVNEDRGATSDLTGEVNIGQQVVDGLKDNDNIDWRFYDSEEEALADTRMSVCYATIVFPEDLSENVIGIFEGSDKIPTVYYYPNEKNSAVATKVTDSAAQTVVEQMNQGFASTVNETLLQTAQSVSGEAEGKIDGARQSVADDIAGTRKDIGSAITALDEALISIEGYKTAIAGMDEALVGAASQLPSVRESLAAGSADVLALRDKAGSFESAFSKALLESGTKLSSLAGIVSADVGTASSDLEKVGTSIDGAIATLETTVSLYGNILDPETIAEINATLETLRQKRADIDGIVVQASATVTSMCSDIQATVASTTNAANVFTTDIMPKLSAGMYGLASALSGLSGALGQFEPQLEQLRSVLAQTDDALNRSVSAIEDAKALLTSIDKNLGSTLTDLRAMGSALQVSRLSQLLDADPDNVGRFISSPVNMITQKVYPVSNYGTAISPFYTNLALWIGCFILISVIRLEVDRKGFEGASTNQRYFGRWLTLIALSLLQSQIICGVDIALGIDCAHPGVFMLMGAVCSFVYMNLIYALVITFRNIGKTLCILLLIMQVPGSSGMYPIEMMPGFFQLIHPALPFTYGIDAMREALCGMVGLRWVSDMGVLLLIVPLSLLIGLVLRPVLLNLTQLFDAEMAKTGFFATEEHGQAGETRRVRSLMRALASHEDYRDDIEERAWAFNRRYPRRRRVGSVAAIAIPLVFVVIMFPLGLIFDLDVNTKLFAFGLMVAILLLVFASLIVLEYAHRSIEEETRLLGNEIMEYSTLLDQAAEIRQAAEERIDERIDEIEQAIHTRAQHVRAHVAESIAGADPTIGENGETAEAPAASEGASAEMHAVAKPTAEQAADQAVREKRKRIFGAAGEIFRTDMRLGFQSVIGVVVIMLLVITPPLYAWFNLAGSWDPYSNTGGLRVAVANQDEGYKGELMPLTVNIGDTIVSQLRGNQSFDWTFVNEEEAVAGVENGEYYAAIVIPSNFSSNMMTYIVEDSEYPDVLYYTNEKENPIAPLITQKGANSIQENIRATFTQRIDEAGLTIAYDLLEYATSPDVSDYIKRMGGHLDDAVRDMGTGSTELKTLSSLSGTVAGIVDTAGIALAGIRDAGQSAKTALAEAESGAASASVAFDEAAALLEQSMPNDSDLDDIGAAADLALSLIESGADVAPDLLSDVAERTYLWAEAFAAIAAGYRMADPPDLEKSAAFDSLSRQFLTLTDRLRTAASDSTALPSDIEAMRADVASLISAAKTDLADAKAFYDNEVKGSIEDLKWTLASAIETTHLVLGGLEGAIVGLTDSTGGLSSQLDALQTGLSNASDKVGNSATKIRDTKARLVEAINSGDVEKMESVLLGSDTAVLAERLAVPIKEERTPVYTVRNFGSNMAPFYTVLSLWVGALVIVSTMRLHVVEERLAELRRRYALVRPWQEFVGRYGIFGFISLFQCVLVLLGDLLFLQIQCDNPVLFMLCGIFVGQVFSLIVYTFAHLFGDIGKALCVILLIMQVAASGGTFPIEMMSGIFVHIAPYLPFHSAMSLLQECVAGVYLPQCIADMSYLLAVVGIMLLIGIVVRKPFRILTDWFEGQLEKTGYM